MNPQIERARAKFESNLSLYGACNPHNGGITSPVDSLMLPAYKMAYKRWVGGGNKEAILEDLIEVALEALGSFNRSLTKNQQRKKVDPLVRKDFLKYREFRRDYSHSKVYRVRLFA